MTVAVAAGYSTRPCGRPGGRRGSILFSGTGLLTAQAGSAALRCRVRTMAMRCLSVTAISPDATSSTKLPGG